MKKWLGLFLVLWGTHAQAQYDPTDQLLTMFGGTCSTSGGLADEADRYASQIQNIIQSIKNDPECQGTTLPGALQGLYDQVAYIQDNTNAPELELLRLSALDDEMVKAIRQRKYELIRENFGERLVQKIQYHEQNNSDASGLNDTELPIESSPGDFDGRSSGIKAIFQEDRLISNWKEDLQSNRLQRIREKGNQAVAQRQQQIDSLRLLPQLSEQLLGTLRSSQACINAPGNENIAAQIGATVLMMSSSYFTEVAGAALLSTGMLINQVMAFLHDTKLQKQMNKLTHSRLNNALGCALEGLASTYCKARDSDEVLENSLNFKENEGHRQCNDPSWQGISMIAQKIAPLQNWLIAIAPSVQATNDQNDTMNRLRKSQELRSSKEYFKISIDSRILEARTELKTLDDPEEKRLKLKSTIDEIGVSLRDNFRLQNFFAEDNSCGPTIYLYSKGTDKIQEKNDEGYLDGCDTYLREHFPNPPSLEEVEPLIDELMVIINRNTERELAKIEIKDYDAVLAQVENQTDEGLSVGDYLLGIEEYLQHLVENPNGINKYQQRFIQNTLKTIQSANEAIWMNNDSHSEDTVQKAAEILTPDRNTSWLTSRLNKIMTLDIQRKLKQGNIDSNLATLMRLSSSTALGEIIRSQFHSLEQIRGQNRQARRQSRTNLSVIGKVFHKNFYEGLRKLGKKKNRTKDDDEALDLMCIRLLLIPEAPYDTLKPRHGLNKKPQIPEFCRQRKYRSIHGEQNIPPLEFNRLATLPFEQRACSIYDFKRISRIYEKTL